MIVKVQNVSLHIDKEDLRNHGDSAEIACQLIGDCAQEVFLVLHINARQQCTGYTEVARGTVNSNSVRPRDVFQAALATNAASIVVAHNHPSGDPTPSPQDYAKWRALREAGNMLGLPVDDFLVVTQYEYHSMGG